jgi:hypothetical protein
LRAWPAPHPGTAPWRRCTWNSRPESDRKGRPGSMGNLGRAATPDPTAAKAAARPRQVSPVCPDSHSACSPTAWSRTSANQLRSPDGDARATTRGPGACWSARTPPRTHRQPVAAVHVTSRWHLHETAISISSSARRHNQRQKKWRSEKIAQKPQRRPNLTATGSRP